MKKAINKKRVLIILAVSVIVIITVLTILFSKVTDGLKEGMNLAVNNINLLKIDDGVYTGTYDYKRWTNTVKVYVNNHNITKIEITNDVTGAGITNCSDEIISRVITAQNANVDAVAGATVTSKAYLKAIEAALKEGYHD